MNTHRFSSPLGRDLFQLGVDMAHAHKQAQNAQKSLLEALERVGGPTEQDLREAAEMDEYYRNMEQVPTADEIAEIRTEGRIFKTRINPHE